MGFLDFPDDLHFRVFDGETDIGTFKPNEDLEIGHIRLMVYIHGTMAGSEQFRINLYSENDVLLIQGDYSDIADITTLDTDWIGWVRFDFNRELINSNTTYIAKVESNNYSRNADILYIAAGYDWPLNSYISVNGAPEYGIHQELYGYKRLIDVF